MNQKLTNRQNLPAGTFLDASYRIDQVIGSGGFGITYLAHDLRLLTTVAIKEYFPEQFGVRTTDQSVAPISTGQASTFEWGRASFLREAQTLARFRHPSVVQVTRVFEANSTAYMVMAFEQGVSLEDWLKTLQRPPKQAELDRIVAPLLDALDAMHKQSFLHRDIAPDNIIIRNDGTPVLLDFGAARRAVAEQSRMLTGLVKQGYSPHEQYSADGRHQGPWTDFYALGATLYRAVTGFPPEEATLRVVEDLLKPATQAAHIAYRPGFLEAIGDCLKVKPSDRPQSVEQVRALLLPRTRPLPNAQVTASKAVELGSGAATGTKYIGTIHDNLPAQPPQRSSAHWFGLAAALAAVLLSAGVGYFYLFKETPRQSEQAKVEKLKTEEIERQRIVERERQEKQRLRLAAEKSAQDERERQRLAEEQRKKVFPRKDQVAALVPGSGASARDNLADDTPCPFCPEMVVVPAGEFVMGSPPSEPRRDLDEDLLRVSISRAFAVGRFAVTFDEWDSCVADGGCNGYRPSDEDWGKGRRPVINVNWNDAKAYASWLSLKTGKAYRLLSEAEREYVTRAGTTTPFWWGSSITPDQANYDGNKVYADDAIKREHRERTVPVDSFQPNPWGLYNVHGNVWEWTEDCWEETNAGNPANGSARTTGDCGLRVLRGGSWSGYPQFLRSANREKYSTRYRSNAYGIRVGRTLTR